MNVGPFGEKYSLNNQPQEESVHPSKSNDIAENDVRDKDSLTKNVSSLSTQEKYGAHGIWSI